MVQETRALRGGSKPSFCEATALTAMPPRCIRYNPESPRRPECCRHLIKDSNQNRKNSLMKRHQTLPNVVWLRSNRKATSSFALQIASLSTIWPNFISQPNRHSDGGWRLCVRSQCRGKREGGKGAATGDLLRAPLSNNTKATLWHRLTHPRKHYFLSN